MSAVDPADGALQLRPTLQYALVKEDRTHGFGGGLELIRYPGASAWRWGVFSEGVGQLDGAWRVAGGLVGGYGFLGTQLGIAHRTAGSSFAAATSLHVAKTLTFGPLGVAFRVSVPLRHYVDAQEPGLARQNVEMAMTLQLGWSFTVLGARPASRGCRPHHGHGHGSAAL